MSAWSRDRRSSASVTTTSNFAAMASSISACRPPPQHRGAGLGAIDIGLDEAVAVALEPLAAKPHLVLDRGVALPVGGEAGIDRGAAHGITPDVRSNTLRVLHQRCADP